MKKEEIPAYIANASPGSVIILDAPSGYGKTAALNKAKDLVGSSMVIVSYEALVNDIVHYINMDETGTDITNALPPLIKKCACFAIEDIDFLEGKEALQDCIYKIVKKIAGYKTTTVVMTGIDIDKKMPEFVRHMSFAQYIKPE